ncbi:MAG: type II toxin-antitoxin system ParD family antitoxin [Thermomicrobiales bacterium]|nr:type II toxin-antitoxin system ParD family antitoxin [Thermomicrobiales bacterium]
MSVTLTPEAENRIRDLVESGHYPDAATVIDKALEALEAQEEAKHHTLRELVRAGFESGNRVELTDDLWDEMERRAQERFQRGETSNLRVGP